jgi:hypothetical protein
MRIGVGENDISMLSGDNITYNKGWYVIEMI